MGHLENCDLEIEWKSLEEIRPYENNPRNIPRRAIRAVADSIQRFGWRQPIVVDREGVIVVGHVRYEAAKHLGLGSVPVHVADFTAEEAKLYRLIDNRTSNLSSWNMTKLDIELKDIQEAIKRGLRIDLSLFGLDDDMRKIRNYSLDTTKIFYEPRGVKPEVSELYDATEAEKLLEEVRKVEDAELRRFLEYSAIRFVRWRFDKIAEYYAHSDDNVKAIFRRLALVIVDFDEALERGWVKLTERIFELLREANRVKPVQDTEGKP
jgi:hypothetical protein